MYSLAYMLQTLAIVAILSGAVCAALYLILPRVIRHHRRPRYSRKG